MMYNLYRQNLAVLKRQNELNPSKDLEFRITNLTKTIKSIEEEVLSARTDCLSGNYKPQQVSIWQTIKNIFR